MFPTFEMLNLYVHQEKKCWITLTALSFFCVYVGSLFCILLLSPLLELLKFPTNRCIFFILQETVRLCWFWLLNEIRRVFVYLLDLVVNRV